MPTRPLILGHRGAPRAAAENTIAAFAQARAQGADGVELDVRRTADEVLVVHHDPTVEGFGLLREHPFRLLRGARPTVPTLVEALASCRGMLVNVEIKCLPWEPDADTPQRAVVHAVVETVRAEAPEAIVSSFDLGAVDAVRAFAPDLTTAWLTSHQVVGRAAEIAEAHGHAWLHPDRAAAIDAGRAGIDEAHARGLRVDVWTVDDPADVDALARAGVDAIITNEPGVVVGLFGDD